MVVRDKPTNFFTSGKRIIRSSSKLGFIWIGWLSEWVVCCFVWLIRYSINWNPKNCTSLLVTIFNPANDSLLARINAWREVYFANEQLKESKKVKNADELDRLGEQQDRLYAEEVITNSYQQATSSLSASDLNQALENDLISKQDYHAFMVAKTYQPIKTTISKPSRTKNTAFTLVFVFLLFNRISTLNIFPLIFILST